MIKYSYSELSFYSVVHDCECYRISVSDGKTGEYFAILKSPGMGKSLLDARARALSAIEAAIEAGIYPGEVKVEETDDA